MDFGVTREFILSMSPAGAGVGVVSLARRISVRGSDRRGLAECDPARGTSVDDVSAASELTRAAGFGVTFEFALSATVAGAGVGVVSLANRVSAERDSGELVFGEEGFVEGVSTAGVSAI